MVRVARQSDRLPEVVDFYRDVVGLPVIGGFDDHHGCPGVMVGDPDGRRLVLVPPSPRASPTRHTPHKVQP